MLCWLWDARATVGGSLHSVTATFERGRNRRTTSWNRRPSFEGHGRMSAQNKCISHNSSQQESHAAFCPALATQNQNNMSTSSRTDSLECTSWSLFSPTCMSRRVLYVATAPHRFFKRAVDWIVGSGLANSTACSCALW